MIEMNLVKVRAHKFFPQSVRFAANEGHLQPRKRGHQKLSHPIRINAGVGIGGLYLAQRARAHQQAMRLPSHEPETFDESVSLDGAGMDQVREILSFHHACIF